MNRLPGAFAVALGLAVIVPLVNYYRPPPSGDFYGEWVSVLFFAIAALFAVRFLPRRSSVTVLLLVGPVVLAGVILLQLAMGRYLYVQDWVLWLGYLGLFAMAVLVGQGTLEAGLDREVISRLAWAFIIIALVSAFSQFVQLARAEDEFAPFVLPLWGRAICRPYGNIGQANQTNTVVWLAIAAALYLAGIGKLARPLAAVLVGALLLSSALTASRMTWVLLALTVLVLFFFRSWPAASPRERMTIAATLIGGFLLATVLSGPLLSELSIGCSGALDRMGGAQRGDLAIRFELWRQALDVWKLNPVLGGGVNSFMGLAYLNDRSNLHQPLDSFVHNEALQLLAEMGAIGAGVIALVVAGWLIALYRRRADLGSPQAVLILWLGVLGVHSMLEFPLHYTYFLIPFGLFVGLLMSPKWAGPTVQVLTRSAVAGLALVTMAACAWVLNDYRAMDRAVYLCQLERTNGGVSTAEFGLSIEQADRDVNLYRVYADYFLSRRIPINHQDLASKIEYNTNILRRGPLADVISRHIILLAFAGDMEGARWHLRQLLKFFPNLQVDEVAAMRRFIASRPDDFPELGAVIDEELARAPERRW